MNTKKRGKKSWWLLAFFLLLVVVMVVFSLPTTEQQAKTSSKQPSYTIKQPTEPSFACGVVFLQSQSEKNDRALFNTSESDTLYLLRVASGGNLAGDPTGYFMAAPRDTVHYKRSYGSESFYIYNKQRAFLGWVGKIIH